MADPRLAGGTNAADPLGVVFYYELGSPDCYLIAEQIMSALPVVPEWEPILLDRAPHTEAGLATAERARVERVASELGLQPVRWPSAIPADALGAMLAATYAKSIGRAVAFSLAAFRQAFAGGRDLGDADTMLIAAAACEMHPTAVLKGIATRAVAGALDEATARARAAGVRSVPAIAAAGQLLSGPHALADAKMLLTGSVIG